MSKHHWQYTNSTGTRVGLMRCTTCNQSIEGDYRYRETEDAYLPQHRDCCASDPMWARLDACTAAEIKQYRVKLAAYQAFRDQWDEEDLDDSIAGIERYLNSAFVTQFEQRMSTK